MATNTFGFASTGPRRTASEAARLSWSAATLALVLALSVGGPLQAQDPPAESPQDVADDQESEAAADEVVAAEAAEEEAADAQADAEADAEEAGGPAQLPELEEAEPFEWSWGSFGAFLSGSETFEGLDGKFKFRLGTTVHIDGTTGSESDALNANFGKTDTSADFRRARLKSHGRLYDFNFALSLELAINVGLRDAWIDSEKGGMSIWGQDLGRFRIGHQKEPFSFERQSSGDFLGFMERSLPVATFAPDHSLGAALHGVTESRRMHWSVGAFTLGSSGQDQDSASAFSLTGRWTGLPIYQDQGRTLLHIGGSFSDRTPSSTTRYFSRPEARFVTPYANTGEIDASAVRLLGAEIAMVKDSVWAQAEWISALLEAPRSGNPDFHGQYVQIGYFLTGESRPYRRNGGVFDSFRPELAYQGKGIGKQIAGGAYELVGRYSNVDLNDGGIRGGRLEDWSLGLNWYVRADTKVSLNYIYAHPEHAGYSNIVLIRFQYAPW